MSGLRFSPRWALSPRDWDIHLSCSKRVIPDQHAQSGTIKGKQQRQEEDKRKGLQQEQWFYIERDGNSNNCTVVHDSSFLPSEGLMYFGQRNQPFNFRGQQHTPSCLGVMPA
jgi:hypothetical protein